MRVLDLFSGIGGFSLGLERAGMTTVAFCEIDPFCQKVLKKHWLDIPIHDDITKLDGKQYAGTVDVVCGGFPCQPFSDAGHRLGKEDDRHLWPEMLRIIKECQPAWVIGENVNGFIRMALDSVCADLEGAGYKVQPVVIPACAVGAPHRRDRVWIIANAEKKQGIYRPNLREASQRLPDDTDYWAANAWNEAKPRICRVDDGIPNRVDRTGRLGNAVVPQIPEIIGRYIMEPK